MLQIILFFVFLWIVGHAIVFLFGLIMSAITIREDNIWKEKMKKAYPVSKSFQAYLDSKAKHEDD